MSKIVNLLLLGETGVGKTAFVNSFLNYFLNANAEDARQKGVAVAAPMNILFTSNDSKRHLIPIQSSNEQPKLATDGKFKEYCIPVGKDVVRLIDSLGFENLTSGDETFEDVFKQLAPLKELHGVSFLIKSSLSRMSNLFEGYMIQTLTAFDVSVANNFLFVFTKGSDVSFDLRHASTVMTGFVDKIRSRIPTARIPLGKENMFCVDNEAFINFGMEHKVRLHQETVKHCVQSWNFSAAECNRLLSYVETLPAYKFPTSGIIKDLEEFIRQKSYTLCDIFGENYKNLKKSKQLKDNSKEACGLIKSIQVNFNSLDKGHSRSVTQKYGMSEHGKSNNSVTKSPHSAYLTEDESPSESEQSKVSSLLRSNTTNSREFEKSSAKSSKTNHHEAMNKNKVSSSGYAQVDFSHIEIPNLEKSKHSNGSRDFLKDGPHSESDKPEVSPRKLINDDKRKKSHHKGHQANSRNSASDSQRHIHTAMPYSDTTQKKLKHIADTMDNQTKLIQNLHEIARGISNSFLKDIAKFEVFLETNKLSTDAFKKQRDSLLYLETDRESWQNVLHAYEEAKIEIKKNSGYNLTDEDIVNIRKNILILQERQNMMNKVFKD